MNKKYYGCGGGENLLQYQSVSIIQFIWTHGHKMDTELDNKNEINAKYV